MRDQYFARAANCVARQIAGETLIVPVRGHVGDLDSIYTLNGVGSTIWELLDGAHSVGQIADALCERYDVKPEQAEQDVAEFVASLRATGLVEPVAGPAE